FWKPMLSISYCDIVRIFLWQFGMLSLHHQDDAGSHKQSPNCYISGYRGSHQSEEVLLKYSSVLTLFHIARKIKKPKTSREDIFPSMQHWNILHSENAHLLSSNFQ